jgi:hypothetical protein
MGIWSGVQLLNLTEASIFYDINFQVYMVLNPYSC